jgi:hypothetical protein
VIISLSAKGTEPVTINPDPALVKVGDNVIWELDFAPVGVLNAIEWTIYFSQANPFNRGKSTSWVQVIQTDGSDWPRALLNAGPALEEGDYKYGVRITNPANRQTLSDDDPRLIVSR